MGHSMSDPLHGVYRTKDEVETQKKRDPIAQLAHRLREGGVIDDARLEALEGEVRSEVAAAAKFAEESPEPDPTELFTHVLAD
jgi:pyruvate dehydrogenase E1 component alpha subunit